jgi:hypothetical protein
VVGQQHATEVLVEDQAAGREVLRWPRLPDAVRVVGEEGEVPEA